MQLTALRAAADAETVIRKNMTISVTNAETIRRHFPYIIDWGRKKNISYHIQYLEYLYKIKKEHDPRLTTLSLSNKTIIIEFFTVIEAVLDALLCQLHVVTPSGSHVSIDIEEYENATKLFQLAKKYKIIDTTLHSQLGQIKGIRNKIHIKRPKHGKPEYSEYTQTLLKQHEKIFKAFIEHLLNEYDDTLIPTFPWPWDV